MTEFERYLRRERRFTLIVLIGCLAAAAAVIASFVLLTPSP